MSIESYIKQKANILLAKPVKSLKQVAFVVSCPKPLVLNVSLLYLFVVLGYKRDKLMPSV